MCLQGGTYLCVPPYYYFYNFLNIILRHLRKLIFDGSLNAIRPGGSPVLLLYNLQSPLHFGALLKILYN